VDGGERGWPKGLDGQRSNSGPIAEWTHQLQERGVIESSGTKMVEGGKKRGKGGKCMLPSGGVRDGRVIKKRSENKEEEQWFKRGYLCLGGVRLYSDLQLYVLG